MSALLHLERSLYVMQTRHATPMKHRIPLHTRSHYIYMNRVRISELHTNYLYTIILCVLSPLNILNQHGCMGDMKVPQEQVGRGL